MTTACRQWRLFYASQAGKKKLETLSMFPWIHHPHADYVLAAYTIAAAALFLIGVFSITAYHRRKKEWEKLETRSHDA
ncbi:MAG: heme exporter protein CcmD [Alphaproteobacteria bacterium]|nr:heme exporter protein CcmD [Alphaproteobacteria bacterium]